MGAKNSLTNMGIPYWVDPSSDLTANGDHDVDSWYMIAAFEAEGKQLAFNWHEQTVSLPNGIKIASAEAYIAEGTARKVLHQAVSGPVGAGYEASEDKLLVASPLGALTGDPTELQLNIQTDFGKINITAKTKHILHNGVTGLLQFMGNSYQYGYIDLDISGTLEFEGETYKVSHATGWFDRQWGINSGGDRFIEDANDPSRLPAWLWIGLNLNNDGAAISLWDAYVGPIRQSFATIRHENGVESMAPISVSYEQIWKSERTGRSYPDIIHVSVPEEEITLTFTSQMNHPEIFQEDIGISGSQNLCLAEGSYRGQEIHRYVLVEMVNDLCGD